MSSEISALEIAIYCVPLIYDLPATKPIKRIFFVKDDKLNLFVVIPDNSNHLPQLYFALFMCHCYLGLLYNDCHISFINLLFI